MGLFNKKQLGCTCCCFVRPPVDPENVSFIASGGSIQNYDDDEIWPYIGRSDDVFQAAADAGNNTWQIYADNFPGWFFGQLLSGVNPRVGIVILDPPLTVADFPFQTSQYSPAPTRPIQAFYGGNFLTEWLVDVDCKRYHTNFNLDPDSLILSPNLRVYRRVIRRPNAPS